MARLFVMSLTERQKNFVKFYIESGKPRESAIKAGYAPKNASKAAGEMLRENKAVMAAIQSVREAGEKALDYDLRAAMREAEEAKELAKVTNNPAAYLAAVKLKAQLMKILDDKPQGAAFQVVISGIGGPDEQKTVVSVTPPSLNSLIGRDEEEL